MQYIKLAGVLLAAFIGQELSAKHLFIYDFDQTITRHHTFDDTCDGLAPGAKISYQDDIKPQAREAFRAVLDSGNLLAIATFHTRIDVIKSYLASFLSEKDLQEIVIAYKGHSDIGMADYKDAYINYIIDVFSDHNIESITFYDDTLAHVVSFEERFAGLGYSIEGVRGRSSPGCSEHMQHTLDKLREIENGEVFEQVTHQDYECLPRCYDPTDDQEDSDSFAWEW